MLQGRVLRSSSTTQQQGGESRNSSITQRPDPGDSHYADPGRGPRNSSITHRQGKGRRGTQALHDEWIPGALTTRIQHAYRGTQALRERNSYVGTLTLRTQILNSRRPKAQWKPGVTRKSPKIKQSRETKRISRKFKFNSFFITISLLNTILMIILSETNFLLVCTF